MEKKKVLHVRTSYPMYDKVEDINEVFNYERNTKKRIEKSIRNLVEYSMKTRTDFKVEYTATGARYISQLRTVELWSETVETEKK